LTITFSSKGTGFEKGFVEPYTSSIDEKSCFYIINCVYDEIKFVPEIVIEEFFIFGTNSKFLRGDIELRVHFSFYSISSAF